MLTPKLKKADFIINGQKIRFKRDGNKYKTTVNGIYIEASTIIEAKNIVSILLSTNG